MVQKILFIEDKVKCDMRRCISSNTVLPKANNQQLPTNLPFNLHFNLPFNLPFNLRALLSSC